MNREDIQRFATQARLPQNYMTGEAMWLDRLEDFAAFVEAKAAAAEREACAKVGDSYTAVTENENIGEFDRGWITSAKRIAAAIRARGQA